METFLFVCLYEQCWRVDQIISLLQSGPSRVYALWTPLPPTCYQAHLAEALKSPDGKIGNCFFFTDLLVPDAVKDELQAFRDITEHSVRKELEKATDSNSEPQRKVGMKISCMLKWLTF